MGLDALVVGREAGVTSPHDPCLTSHKLRRASSAGPRMLHASLAKLANKETHAPCQQHVGLPASTAHPAAAPPLHLPPSPGWSCGSSAHCSPPAACPAPRSSPAHRRTQPMRDESSQLPCRAESTPSAPHPLLRPPTGQPASRLRAAYRPQLTPGGLALQGLPHCMSGRLGPQAYHGPAAGVTATAPPTLPTPPCPGPTSSCSPMSLIFAFCLSLNRFCARLFFS